jgi:nucleoside-diphosphate-sugar epimerase
MAGKVVVAGASGLVGRAAVERFAAAGWEVVGLSRRTPPLPAGVRHLAVDLTDAAATETVVDELLDATHLVYAALEERPGLFGGWLEEDLIERNGSMLRHLIVPLSARSRTLRHVSLLHGTKAYGFHHPAVGLDAVRVPLREREPRREHPNFYFVQEDLLHGLQAAGAPWGLTVFRPTVVVGDAPGVNMNPFLPLAAYATIRRELGEPFGFPGRGWRSVREMVTDDLVAAALVWAAVSPAAVGGTFNLTNGDVFSWAAVWPALAEAFGVEPGPPTPVRLGEWLPAHDDVWADLVERYGLDAPPTTEALAGFNSLIYADFVLGSLGPDPDGDDQSAGPRPPAILNSTIAVRQAGFAECVDTEDALVGLVERLRARRVIPLR